jgi:hypothetical protein
MKKMKKTLLTLMLCVVLLSTPTLLALPTMNESSFYLPPLKMSDGTFVGGIGRGHWKNGFHIDTVNAYYNGVYSSFGFIKLSGEITNPNNKKIGEISLYIISKFMFGYTQNMQGRRTLMFVYLVENGNDQFIGHILYSSFKSSPHIWGYLIPNK